MHHRPTLGLNRSGSVLQSLAAACVLFCPAADAAPTTVKSSMSVSARVSEVDCTNRHVKIRACAPAIVLREMPEGTAPAVLSAPAEPKPATPVGMTTTVVIY
jgi:hypothetical protein